MVYGPLAIRPLAIRGCFGVISPSHLRLDLGPGLPLPQRGGAQEEADWGPLQEVGVPIWLHHGKPVTLCRGSAPACYGDRRD